MRTTDSPAAPEARPLRRRASLTPASTRSRMLAALALAGAAALTVGCAGQPAAPGAPTPTDAMVASVPGADPVPIDDARLEEAGLMDEVSEQGYALRWSEPGASIAVFVGGSGSGGGCIPQPSDASLEQGEPRILVAFESIDPAVSCTMDFRLHGWELGLADTIDDSRAVPVRLMGLQGDDDVIETELAPEQVLGDGDANGADPQPSEVDDAPRATVSPTPFDASGLPQAQSIVEGASALDVWWIEPGRTLAVVMSGSGTEACVPQPIDARAAGPGAIDIAFAPAAGDTCTDDLVVYGWQLELPSAVTATLPVQVTLSGTSDAGETVQRTLDPGDVLELP
ncbi:hypothetical protein AA0Z99_08210 [Agrococcus sp. 1P02AA]|uniref:hypothetical protein n=1 Tax=Agrococcus sp. 1P02AA TaxID=3132259 RepID=UPI0039A50109